MARVVSVIAPLFVIIFAGIVLGRVLRHSDTLALALNRYAVDIGLPVLIFLSLSRLTGPLAGYAALAAANSLLLIGCFLAARAAAALFHLDDTMARTLFFCLGFGNVAFLGIPVLAEVYGPGILPEASLIVGIYLLWMFTVGAGVLERRRCHDGKAAAVCVARGIVANPLLAAVLAGLALALAGWVLPGAVARALEMVSASVTPVVLVVVGLFIGNSRFGGLRRWAPALAFSLATLLLVPAAFTAAIWLAGQSPAHFGSSILQSAMPLAIAPFAVADRYGLDKEFIARSIVLSTILSAVTIPLWASLP